MLPDRVVSVKDVHDEADEPEAHDAEGRRPRDVVLIRLGEPVADEKVALQWETVLLYQTQKKRRL